MSDPLLRYFEQELAVVKRSLGQFGDKHPRHAENLNIHQGKIEDPSIARLLDGVALLNAKVEKQLSEQLPEVVEGLLGILFPSYVQTVPSIAYIKLEDIEGPIESATLPKGAQFSATVEEQECQFQTVDELKVTPFSITNISALGAPFNFNRPKIAEHSSAVIQITLSTGDPDVHFRHLDIEDLDFFVQGFENNADSLVEQLLSQTRAISVSDISCEQHTCIDANSLKNRISDLSFTFLPQHGNQFSGYQLMSEYFFFKEKRQFFRLKGFGRTLGNHASSEVVVNLFLSSLPSEFVRLFNLSVFKLNVVPAINLFEESGEPIRYDQRTLTAPVNTNAHFSDSTEIYDIKEIYEITSSGEIPLLPLFKNRYNSTDDQNYWQVTRDAFGEHKLMVSLGDNSAPEFNKLFGTRLLCSNGKLACGIEGVMECKESIDLPGEFSPIYPPSAPIEREYDQNLHWQFIGMLNSNFSSLLHSQEANESLKQMLQLCCRNQISDSDIQTIRSVTFNSQVSAIRILGKNTFSPGTEIDIELDTNAPFHAFSDVLNRFFQQFCSFDRYIQLNIRIFGRDGIIKRYAKVHGSQLCL
ncbi:type VI secretion system baseplate subunit TssF [Vibrio sp. ZSDE26]|uniref:Type VI secretion system baseplate subunit TssF n=1 Tax=Vibrio amylolyticus TaxID=2847292 RepID=A0A9X2BIY0_9VIBR|nr:type VI secretion system baseplate subunit TssF [Vibrio amylolyticus]MCK6265159.1 type VI secretion system baseplate subunit TssF [Vibrio amylolyticus]